MSNQVALSFEDGVTRFITCEDGQTVADASYRARINIPLDCRDGACGTCKSFCESGEYDGGSYIEDALTDDEAEQGYCLPCQMKPTSDLVLQIPSTSAVAKTQAATYRATITELVRYSETTVGVTMKVDERAKLGFLPGQYVNIAVPGTDESRSYSFSNAPGDELVSFLVKITPGGVMSTYLTERAAVGDELSITGPNGSFFVREAARPALLLAGGTGLAPILAILRSLRDQNSDRRIHLVYGVSSDADVVELDTLEELTQTLPNFTWDYCVADESSSAEKKGYVTAYLTDEHLNDSDVAVYLCGPPPMVEAVRSHFSTIGVEPSGFYYEKFALAGAPKPAAVTGALEVEPDATSADVEAAPGRTPADLAVSPDVVDIEAAHALDPELPTPAPATATRPASSPVADEATALITDPEARRIVGQIVFARAEGSGDKGAEPIAVAGVGAPKPVDDERRGIAGQIVFATASDAERGVAGPSALADDDGALHVASDARGIAGQEMFAANTALEQLVAPVAATRGVDDAHHDDAHDDGYVIGEEHPSITQSDAVFEARQALELGALELTIGRMDSRRIAGYRLLAEATLPYVDGDRFVDAHAFTETNAAFHDYLFTCTGNEHLLEAYRRLGVKNAMDTALHDATWCHPSITQDHVDIVEAFDRGDRDAARTLIQEHSERSKETMRRAMHEKEERRRPVWVSAGRFADKVVLVTGAAQGIGERVARRICAEGGHVVLADRSDLVGEVASDAADLGPGTAAAVTGDLETYAGAQAAVDAALAKHGRIDVAIHNVGGAICFKPFEQFTPEQIDAEITRSLMTTLYGCRAVLPHLIEAGGGTIVNVSSIATGGIYRVPYAAAKGGVNAITRALAVEGAEHGVRVVASAPGGTEAPPRRIPRGAAPEGDQEQAWFQAHIDQTLDTALLHRYGTLDEQAAAICFLASHEAAYITGTVLPVGGGDLG